MSLLLLFYLIAGPFKRSHKILWIYDKLLEHKWADTELYSLNINNCLLSLVWLTTFELSIQLYIHFTVLESASFWLFISTPYFNLHPLEIFTVRVNFQFARDLGGVFELSGWQLFSESSSILVKDNKAHLSKNRNNFTEVYILKAITLISLIHTAGVKEYFIPNLII